METVATLIFEEHLVIQIVLRWGFCNEQFKRVERLTQHRSILLAVVSEPSFPQSVSPNATIGDVGFGVGDDVLDVLSRSQLDAISKELLRGYRGNSRFLVIACSPTGS